MVTRDSRSKREAPRRETGVARKGESGGAKQSPNLSETNPQSPSEKLSDYMPCPLCKQYSHSIPEDKLAAAFMHFEAMVCGNPLKSWPTHHAFDEQTRDFAQILVAAARTQGEG